MIKLYIDKSKKSTACGKNKDVLAVEDAIWQVDSDDTNSYTKDEKVAFYVSTY